MKILQITVAVIGSVLLWVLREKMWSYYSDSQNQCGLYGVLIPPLLCREACHSEAVVLREPLVCITFEAGGNTGGGGGWWSKLFCVIVCIMDMAYH